MRSKQSDKMHKMTQTTEITSKRKKRKKKKSEDDSIASSDCDSDLQLPSSKRAKSIETNELNIPHEPNETNSQYEEFADFNETIEIDNDQVIRELRTNRFQIFHRLGQVYCVDMVTRAIDKRLNYIIRDQTKFKMGSTWKSKYDIDDFDNDFDGDNDDDD